MGAFLKEFLLEDARRLGGSSGRQIFVAAFGKHPGWDDHIEDIGLRTETLVTAKHLIYVQGIGRQIDSGAWEKLEPEQQLPTFKHLFVWRRGPQFLFGRMWSSTDGKGRSRYPMAVCCHCLGVSLRWAMDRLIRRLEQIEAACKATVSATEVVSIMSRLQNELSTAPQAAGIDPVTNPQSMRDQSTRLIELFGSGPDHKGLLRILYQMQLQMGAYAPGRMNAKADQQQLRPQQIRVPADAGAPDQTMVFWDRFFTPHFDPAAPILFTLPLGESWLDITLGEPSEHEFHVLRATTKALPLASDVPYNLDPQFCEQASHYLAAVQSGNLSTALPKRPLNVAGESSPPGSTTQRWRKWLGFGAVFLLAVLLAAGLATASFKKLSRLVNALPDRTIIPGTQSGKTTVADAPELTPSPTTGEVAPPATDSKRPSEL